MTIERTAFYKAITPIWKGATLPRSVFLGLEPDLDAWEAYGDGDLRKLAIILGNEYRETGGTMLPVKEKGGHKYLAKYDTGKLAKALGNTPEADGDGELYAGRGDVQLTGKRNYALFSKLLGIDLVRNPDLALDPKVSAQIIVIGMMRGLFTGKKLADFVNDKFVKWEESRRVVNGMDHAAEIAAMSKRFYAALLAAVEPGTAVSVAPEAPPAPMTKSVTTGLQVGVGGLGTLTTVKAAIDLANETVTKVKDTTAAAKGAASDTADAVVTTVKIVHDNASWLGWAGRVVTSPTFFLIVGGLLVIAAVVTIIRRKQIKDHFGV